MTKRQAELQFRYGSYLSNGPPKSIDPRSWTVFTRHIRDLCTYRQISAELSISEFQISRVLAHVAERLDGDARNWDGPGLTLESPLDKLEFSTRTRNALRRMNCLTVRDVLGRDFNRAPFRLGAGTKAEIARALKRYGFDTPRSLSSRDDDPAGLLAAINKLRDQVDSTCRAWNEQLDRIERRIDHLVIRAAGANR